MFSFGQGNSYAFSTNRMKMTKQQICF